jgi:tRNA threonylcarbamoyladenosine biosynthesis protein TsaB
MSPGRDGRRRILLAIDTATTEAVAAIGGLDGEPEGITTWAAGYRHGETLLPIIGRLLGEGNARRSRIDAVIVGTGPGSFTGLRVGMATAKGLAHGLGRPIVGVSTGDALIAAIAREAAIPADRVVLLLPAGPTDRTLVRHRQPAEVLRAGDEPVLAEGERLAAVDLPDRAPADALELGTAGRRGLAAELLRIGAERLAADDADDLAELVPVYVTLPRGVAMDSSHAEVAWSRDPR